MRPFLISPPFGNWIKYPNATPVLGSYTLRRRPGLIRRALLTVRPVPGGWVNAIGLRNPGIKRAPFRMDRIISVVGLEPGDWTHMLDYVPRGSRIELNLGCPNVHEYGISEQELRLWLDKADIIVKLPPVRMLELLEVCASAGATTFHLCNTLPTERGGESGARLREVCLPLVREARRILPAATIIGGGGIYAPDHVRMYRDAGADHFSLSTVWFKPWRARTILGAPDA